MAAELDKNRTSQTPPAPQATGDLTDRWAIFDLVARYDDAANRRDVAEFKALWAEDAVWEVGDPKPLYVQGAAKIAETWQSMLHELAWLFRGSFAGVVTIEGEKAAGRWPCIETGTYAETKDGAEVGYDNRSVFEDVYVKRDGHWLFQHRRYLYLYLSSQKLPGDAVKLGAELLPDTLEKTETN